MITQIINLIFTEQQINQKYEGDVRDGKNVLRQGRRLKIIGW